MHTFTFMNLYEHVKNLFIGDPVDKPTTKVQCQSLLHRQTHAETTNTSLATATHSTTKQRRYFTGTVTSVNEESGMIDNHVFFDLDSVIGGLKPVVGGAAHVTAVRAHEHAGWRATRIELTSEWCPEEDSETELVVGVVSGLSRTKCVVESGSREVTFAPREYQPVSGYRPHVGDSIEVGYLKYCTYFNFCSLRNRLNYFIRTGRLWLMD